MLMRKKQDGITLIELMIGLLVGLIITGGILSFFIAYNKSNFDLIRTVRLEQEMRATIDFITRDLKRAGYSANAHTNIGGNNYCNNAYYDCSNLPISPATFRLTISGSNLSYAYTETNGTLNTYSFRLGNDGAIYFTANGSETQLTDPSITNYSALSFTPTVRFVDLNSSSPGSSGLAIREVIVAATATLVGDNVITRTFTETVRIRNDEYR
jgi:prepilin peptidase dependent protein B